MTIDTKINAIIPVIKNESAVYAIKDWAEKQHIPIVQGFIGSNSFKMDKLSHDPLDKIGFPLGSVCGFGSSLSIVHLNYSTDDRSEGKMGGAEIKPQPFLKQLAPGGDQRS